MLTDRIQPVRLPKFDDIFVESEVIASGWGSKHMKYTGLASQLQWASLKIITNSQFGKSFPILIQSTAESQKESYCGGPLVLQNDNRTLIGVTSFGYASSCHFGIPQVYTRITSLWQWIKKI